WKEFLLNRFSGSVLHLHNVLHWNTNLKNFFFKMSVLNRLINISFYFIFISRISMYYIPICLCHAITLTYIVRKLIPYLIIISNKAIINPMTTETHTTATDCLKSD